VCLEFHEPVTGIDPLGLIRHPGLTVTVADPEGLAAALAADAPASSSSPRLAVVEDDADTDEEPLTEIEEERQEQAAEDTLHTMTAAELRALAKERGLSHPASLKKDALVELLQADLGDDLVEELAPEA